MKVINPILVFLIPLFFCISMIYAPNDRESSFADPDDCLDHLKIPKEFSPEADTLNVFAVNFPCPPETFAIQVFHPSGERVYFSENYKFQWNGNDMNDSPCETQVYSWKLNYKYQMQNVILKGSLLLLR